MPGLGSLSLNRPRAFSGACSTFVLAAYEELAYTRKRSLQFRDSGPAAASDFAPWRRRFEFDSASARRQQRRWS